MKTANAAGWFLAWTLIPLSPLVGCQGVPRPPMAVNAVLPNHLPIYRDAPLAGDTVVVARFHYAQEYHQIRKSDWVDHWSVAVFDVLRVERGTWADPTISFIYVDSWPTIESGILLGKALLPYRAGAVLVFGLNTSTRPATILTQQTQAPAPSE